VTQGVRPNVNVLGVKKNRSRRKSSVEGSAPGNLAAAGDAKASPSGMCDCRAVRVAERAAAAVGGCSC
jgi:hypothetical protein